MMPLKLAMAQVIARKILADPGKFRVSNNDFARLQEFTSKEWDERWKKNKGYYGWEVSEYYFPLRDRLPEILEKLALDNSPEE
jgi:hypothetical protein